jgi:phage gp36-like protein
MDYTSQAAILAKFSLQALIAATDDSGTGNVDNGILETIIQDAGYTIDGFLEATYSLPLSTIPEKVSHAALIFCCESLYQRRLAPEEKNIFSQEANQLRRWLEKISTGEISLSFTIPKALPPVVGITECMSMDYNTR